MQNLLKIALASTSILVSCNADRAARSPNDISIVDEVYGLSQGLDTDGLEPTVRGWLALDNRESDYKLYNAAWDPFDPQTKKGVSYLVLKFDSRPSDYWIGQYVTVAGRVATESKDSSGRIVALIHAKIVSTKIKDGVPIPYRIQEPKKDR